MVNRIIRIRWQYLEPFNYDADSLHNEVIDEFV